MKQIVVFKMSLQKPRNFSWLEEGKIAALAFPDKREDLEFLVNAGVRYLVTLTKELKPQLEEVPALIGVDICVDDYCTFTMVNYKFYLFYFSKVQIINIRNRSSNSSMFARSLRKTERYTFLLSYSFILKISSFNLK